MEVIDLGWARRQPRLLPVLAAVCSELYVEAAYVAEELADTEYRAGLTAALAPLKSTVMQGGCDFPATPT